MDISLTDSLQLSTNLVTNLKKSTKGENFKNIKRLVLTTKETENPLFLFNSLVLSILVPRR